jgi:outer membrane murein-binding lipoprotein Lpp
MTRAKLGLLASVAAGLVLAGCVTGPVYTKKTDRESATIDVLDCNKVALVAHRAARKRYADPESEQARQKGALAAKAAWRRCMTSHGWKKKDM